MAISAIWRRGAVIREVPVATPALASWDSKTAPSQIRLNSYLSELILSLAPLPVCNEPLFLHFQIGVADPGKLLIGCDLENYLFPLFGTKWLPQGRFALVSASKRVGVGHRLAIGFASPEQPPLDGWETATVDAGPGYEAKLWKERVRDKLATQGTLLPAGAAEVQIAFRCSPRRNWTNLWKPSGDSMGPILGVTRSDGFNPCDDRIVDLSLHRIADLSVGHGIELGFWWRQATV